MRSSSESSCFSRSRFRRDSGLLELLLNALLLAFQVNAAEGADCGLQNLRG